MSALTDARDAWTALEYGRKYFTTNRAINERNYSLHIQRGRLLDLADCIVAAGSVDGGVEAFRHTVAMPADPNEIAAAAELAGIE
jgi:hypothetical protein